MSKPNRLIFYETLINHFLAGAKLPAYDEVSDELRVAFACAVPQIRAMQSKYDNGTAEKITIVKTKASLCPSETSETKRTGAEQSDSYINNIPFPKILNIIYKYINTNQSSAGAHAYTRDETNKKTSRATAEAALAQLESENQSLLQFFYQIIQKVDSDKTIKINGAIVPSATIMQAMLDLTQQPSFIQVLESAQAEADSPNVRDKLKYAISVLYNFNSRLQTKPAKPHSADGFGQRQYSEEELNSLFDTMEDIEID